MKGVALVVNVNINDLRNVPTCVQGRDGRGARAGGKWARRLGRGRDMKKGVGPFDFYWQWAISWTLPCGTFSCGTVIWYGTEVLL